MGMPSGGGWISIRRSAEKTPAKFGYDKETGYFGTKFKDKRSSYYRTISSDNPQKDAEELFSYLVRGGTRVPTDNPHQELYRLPDGTYVSLRIFTSTDGSPAVEISIRKNPNNTKVKSQKIHFIDKTEGE